LNKMVLWPFMILYSARKVKKNSQGDKVLISCTTKMEVETQLQTQV
jgi:hypothetical protein